MGKGVPEREREKEREREESRREEGGGKSVRESPCKWQNLRKMISTQTAFSNFE
jgi:hypothetical protein